MKEKKSLDAIFKEKKEREKGQTDTEATVSAVSESKKRNLPATRQGKRIVSGWFDVEVHKQLRMIAAEDDKTIEKVLGDAINALFTNRGIPPIA